MVRRKERVISYGYTPTTWTRDSNGIPHAGGPYQGYVKVGTTLDKSHYVNAGRLTPDADEAHRSAERKARSMGAFVLVRESYRARAHPRRRPHIRRD
jgi:hypothetical protein